jgi:hypothetical protein
MRRIPWAGIAVLLLTCSAGAQINSKYSLPAAIPLSSLDPMFAPGAAAANETFAAISPGNGVSATPAMPLPASVGDPNPPEPPQGVYGVFPASVWEASAGYTFVRFYEVPGVAEDANGVNASLVYYLKDWIGAEGEVFVAFGTLSGSTSHLLLGAGGPRLRWSASRGIELWGHALAGFSILSPQMPYGKGHAFGYEAGAGVDINAHHHRWAYRIEGDAVGTFYFNTYQVSPKVSLGVVYKF